MMGGMDEIVFVERRDDGVALVTLNRPAARNAVNVQLAQAIVDAMGRCANARCVVLTGADPAFCAGLDLRDLGTDRLDDLPHFIDAVAASGVPTIAAVNGAAVTGGFELALACDFIVASEHARFADTHLRVGVYPGPVLVELPRRIGMARAREMSLTGNFLEADEARRIGLANHVVPHASLLPFAFDLAAAIAEQDPAMVSAMREDWDETGGLPRADAHRRHRELSEEHGFHRAGSDILRRNMESVIERAHRTTTGRSPGT